MVNRKFVRESKGLSSLCRRRRGPSTAYLAKSASHSAQDDRISFGTAEGVPYRFVAVALLTIMLAGCGYHQVGSATHIPAGTRTIEVPIFQSKVQGYRVETAFTQAVVRELNTRTKFRVLTAGGDADNSADATLRGTILTETVAPLTYDASSGQTSSYIVTVTAKVELVSRDGNVLYRNDAFGWHEQYQSTQDLSGFVEENGAAVRRMAHDFAQAVVSEMLESF